MAVTRSKTSKKRSYRAHGKSSPCKKLGRATCRRKSGCKQATGRKRAFCRRTRNRKY